LAGSVETEAQTKKGQSMTPMLFLSPKQAGTALNAGLVEHRDFIITPTMPTMPGQSCKGSALEVVSSTAFGMIISFFANALLFPMFGVHVSTSQNIALVAIYTVISVARQYAFRRLFNFFAVRYAT
jgi:hypothetical protein